MASIEKRIQDLERLYNMTAPAEDPEERERLEAKMRANLARAEEMAAAEEAEGNLDRRHALDDLYAWMEREAHRES